MIARMLAEVGVVSLFAGLWLRLRQRDEPIDEGIPEPAFPSRLEQSLTALRRRHPEFVADRTVTRRQQEVLLPTLAVVVFCAVLSPTITIMVLVAGAIAVYIASLVVRLRILGLGLSGAGLVAVTDEDARAYPEDRLPVYSVLVPAFHEPEVFASLVEHLRALDYPKAKLDIQLLLEADDDDTVAAARQAVGDAEDIRIVLVPVAEPRTKPKALNYGLTSARGELVTIYDAEDRPEPLQLRKAAIALAEAPREVACVQARLGFFNPHQNLLTRWFTLDYRMWFGELLPGLVQLKAPIPLGGTSNHFRKDVLVEVGAWDAWNVTEDADLGIRLYRLGYRTGVIDSTTYEEANSDVINWVKQRSRWYKGYAQTLLVHLRHPAALRRDVGWRGFALTALLIGGAPVLACMNSLFWSCVLVWFLFHPAFFREVLPTLTYFLGMVSWVGGNAIVLYTWLLSARRTGDKLVLAALLSPLYWVLMAAAATKAAVQLVTAPSYWEKTQHGLDVVAAAPRTASQAA